jgi:hypothetical protein
MQPSGLMAGIDLDVAQNVMVNLFGVVTTLAHHFKFASSSFSGDSAVSSTSTMKVYLQIS